MLLTAFRVNVQNKKSEEKTAVMTMSRMVVAVKLSSGTSKESCEYSST